MTPTQQFSVLVEQKGNDTPRVKTQLKNKKLYVKTSELEEIQKGWCCFSVQRSCKLLVNSKHV